MKKNTLLFILILLSKISYSQGFIAAVGELPPLTVFEIELIDGTIIKGKNASATTVNGFLKSIGFKDSARVRQKYKAEQIKLLKVKTGASAKIDMMTESSSSIKNLLKTDFNEIIKREYLYYERALLPKKKDKYRLLQLLNPGFDSVIKVYQDPNAKETAGVYAEGSQLVGGDDKSYLVVKNGGKSEEIKKSKYKKQFPELFAGCDLAEMMKNSKIKFKNFANHVYIYDQICAPKDSVPME